MFEVQWKHDELFFGSEETRVTRAVVNGIATYYEVYGTGQPLLYIHGGTLHPAEQYSSSGVVGRLPSAVASLQDEAVQVIHYHRRGYGRTERVLTPYAVADLAGDAIGLLDHLGVETAIVVGQSLGEPIALELALSSPPRVKALCLADTASLWLVPDAIEGILNAHDLVERVRRDGHRAVFDSEKKNLRNPQLFLTPSMSAEEAEWAEDYNKNLLRLVQSLSDEALFIGWTVLLREWEAVVDYSPQRAELEAPACIIHGAADRLVTPRLVEALRALLPQAEYHCIEGSGHGTIQMHPGAIAVFRDWVLRILRGT